MDKSCMRRLNFYAFGFLIFFSFCSPDLKSKLNFIYSLSQANNNNSINPIPPNAGNNGNPATAPTISYPNANYNLRLSRTILSITPITSGSNLQFSISPLIPPGLSFDTTTGILSGAATTIQTAINYTVQVTNSAGSASASFTILIVGQEPKKQV
jgi:hypothetical protein